MAVNLVDYQFSNLIIIIQIILMASFLFYQTPSVEASYFSYCDNKGDYPVKMIHYYMNDDDDPLRIGVPLFLVLYLSTNQTITNGIVLIDIFYLDFVPIYTKSIDLCSIIAHPLHCPVATGRHFFIHHLQYLPLLGPYIISMGKVEKSGYLLTCMDFYFSVWPSSISHNIR